MVLLEQLNTSHCLCSSAVSVSGQQNESRGKAAAEMTVRNWNGPRTRTLSDTISSHQLIGPPQFSSIQSEVLQLKGWNCWQLWTQPIQEAVGSDDSHVDAD